MYRVFQRFSLHLQVAVVETADFEISEWQAKKTLLISQSEMVYIE
jgi:hypothetical protein